MTRRTRAWWGQPNSTLAATAAATGLRSVRPDAQATNADPASPPSISDAARPMPESSSRGAVLHAARASGRTHGAQVRAEQRQFLAQVQQGRQFAHGDLPGANHVRRRRCQQPGRQHVFTAARSRSIDTLEQGRRPDDVEVRGVEVRVVEEAVTVFAARGPPVLEMSQATLVEVHGAFVSLPRACHGPVHEDQHAKRDHRSCQPEG